MGAGGDERMVDAGTAAPTDTWHAQGDVRFKLNPVAGGYAGWIDIGAGASFRPFGPVANDAGGTEWSLPIVINTYNTFATLPTCNASLKGAHQFITDGPASPTFTGAAAGGGSLFVPVYCDGTTWRNG